MAVPVDREEPPAGSGLVKSGSWNQSGDSVHVDLTDGMKFDGTTSANTITRGFGITRDCLAGLWMRLGHPTSGSAPRRSLSRPSWTRSGLPDRPLPAQCVLTSSAPDRLMRLDVCCRSSRICPSTLGGSAQEI